MQATLQEQLRAALNKWEQEEKAAPAPAPAAPVKTYPFQVSNNLNRAAFNEIRDNPGTRKQINDTLVSRGYKLGSVSAVIGQMLRQGVAQLDDEGVLHVTVSEYVPLKSHKTLANMKKKQKQIVVDVRKKKVTMVEKVVKEERRPVSSSAGIAALSPAPAPAPAVFVPAAVPPEQFVLHALESMSVLQARAVYDELKKIFGESK